MAKSGKHTPYFLSEEFSQSWLLIDFTPWTEQFVIEAEGRKRMLLHCYVFQCSSVRSLILYSDNDLLYRSVGSGINFAMCIILLIISASL
jgi:hypothetical protein